MQLFEFVLIIVAYSKWQAQIQYQIIWISHTTNKKQVLKCKPLEKYAHVQ